MDSNHCQIVAESISGKRAIDEQTFASLTILEERLQRLKQIDSAFEDVSFSPAIDELMRRKNTIAIR